MNRLSLNRKFINLSGKIPWKHRISIFLVITCLIVLWVNKIPFKSVYSAFFLPAMFVFQYSLATAFLRTVTVKQIISFYLVGMSIVPAVCFVTQYYFYRLLQMDFINDILTHELILGRVNLMGPVVAPITEEILKICPLLFFLFWRIKASWRRIVGPVDCFILAAATGAGFGTFEGMVAAIKSDFQWPLNVTQILSIGPFSLFPELSVRTYWLRLYDCFFIGHGTISAFIGLTVGLWLLWRKTRPVSFLLPVVALLWSIVHHFLINYTHTGSIFKTKLSQTWIKLLYYMDLSGYLIPVIIIIGLIYAIYLTTVNVKWQKKIEPSTNYNGIMNALILCAKTDLFKLPLHIFHLSRYFRYRRIYAFGLRDFVLTDPKKSVHWAAWLGALRQQVLNQKLKVFDRKVA